VYATATDAPCRLDRDQPREVLGGMPLPPPPPPAQLQVEPPPPRPLMGVPVWHEPPSQPAAHPTKHPAPGAGKRAR
jgi:hypothetical protein